LAVAATSILLTACGDRSTAIKELGGKQILCRTYDTPTKEVFARSIEATDSMTPLAISLRTSTYGEDRRQHFIAALRRSGASHTFRKGECDKVSNDLCLISVQCREVALNAIRPVARSYLLIIDIKDGKFLPVKATRRLDDNPVDSTTGRKNRGIVFWISRPPDLTKRIYDAEYEGGFWPLGE